MITASIVTYKTNREELKTVVKCADCSIISKIYIIDNSPTNELSEFITSLSLKVDYIFMNSNMGYGYAHNVAIRKSLEQSAEYHVVLNPDIEFDSSVIAELQIFMDKNNDAGAVMPKVLYPSGELQYLCKMQVTPYDFFLRRFMPIKSIREKRNYYYELRGFGYDKLINAPCLSGCFMFLRNSALKEVGLFDERFFMYCEDFDLYKRLHKKFKTIFYPYCHIYHTHKKESAVNGKLLLAHIISSFKYFNKWGWFFDSGRRISNKKIKEYINTLS